MQAFAPDTKLSRIPIVWLGDPAVANDPPPPDPRPEGWEPPTERYERTLDRSALVLTGDPRTYVLRPLNGFEATAVAELSFSGVLLSYLAYVVLGAALVEVTGPHPVSAETLRRARTRDPVTGLTTIPQGSPIWLDRDAFPGPAMWEVTNLYLRHQGRVTQAAGSTDEAARRADPGN